MNKSEIKDVGQTVPLHQKLNLTIRETAEYSNIGINKIDDMLISEKNLKNISAKKLLFDSPRY